MERLLTLLLQVVKQVTRWIPGLPSSRRPKAVAYYPGMSRRKRGRATQKGPAQPKRSSKGHEADPPGDLAGGTAEMTQYDADQSSSSEPHTVPDPVPDQPVQVEPTPDATCQWSAGECTVSPLVAATPANPQPPGEPSEPTLAKSERLQILPPPSGDFDVLGVHDRSATDLDDPAPESAGAAPTAPEKPPAGLSFAAGALSAKRPQDNDRTAENPVPTALKARGSHPQPGLSLVVQAGNQNLSRDVVSEPRAFPPAPIRGGHGVARKPSPLLDPTRVRAHRPSSAKRTSVPLRRAIGGSAGMFPVGTLA